MEVEPQEIVLVVGVVIKLEKLPKMALAVAVMSKRPVVVVVELGKGPVVVVVVVVVELGKGPVVVAVVLIERSVAVELGEGLVVVVVMVLMKLEKGPVVVVLMELGKGPVVVVVLMELGKGPVVMVDMLNQLVKLQAATKKLK